MKFKLGQKVIYKNEVMTRIVGVTHSECCPYAIEYIDKEHRYNTKKNIRDNIIIGSEYLNDAKNGYTWVEAFNLREVQI